MTDWLGPSMPISSDTPHGLLAFRIGTALLLGVVVAGLYRWALRGEAVQPTFQTTLILLATVMAMATQVIGDDVARAFSLVGALSVVRFRTVVKDTQDTALVIFAVVVGMASGADRLGSGWWAWGSWASRRSPSGRPDAPANGKGSRARSPSASPWRGDPGLGRPGPGGVDGPARLVIGRDGAPGGGPRPCLSSPPPPRMRAPDARG